MAEKNDNDNHFPMKNSNVDGNAENFKDEDGALGNAAAYFENEVQIVDESPSNLIESGAKKEENPFSFKKFLNQDNVSLKHQTTWRRNYSPENASANNENMSTENQNFIFSGMDNNSKVLNTSEMASVLPDFVQDHLVIEQCYLNGSSSSINIDNLNLQNLPDLNLQHRQAGFNSNGVSQRSDLNSHSLSAGINNLPDFTSDVRQFSGRSDSDGFCNSKTLPDFTVNTSDGVSRTLGRDEEFLQMGARDTSTRRKTIQRNCGMSEESPSGRNAPKMSSSPSVPLDLPSYDGTETVSVPSGSLDQPIPFDLTVAAEDRNGSYRGMPSTETVSKSLPDFLSDGPIQNDRLGENFQHANLVSSLHDNGSQRISHSENISERRGGSRIQRELEMLRREVSEKDRMIDLLEREVEDLRSRFRQEPSHLEHSLHQHTERALRHALDRASKAEGALMKSRLENNKLRIKLSALRVENTTLQPDNGVDDSNKQSASHRIAKELRTAADAAEASLRSLLTGIDNLRMIAGSIEGMQIYNEKTDEMDEFNNEDSASGPAL